MTDSLPTPLRLTRSDPAQNMARYYAISIEPTLFGEVSLVRSWGRIGTRGLALVETFDGTGEAEAAAGKLERTKRRRGYRSDPTAR